MNDKPNPLFLYAMARSKKAARSFLHCCEDVGYEIPTNILGMAAADMDLLASAIATEATTLISIYSGMSDHFADMVDRLENPETCAKIADDLAARVGDVAVNEQWKLGYAAACEKIANEIRASRSDSAIPGVG